MSGRNLVMALDVGSSTARTVLVDPAGSIVGEGRSPVVWKHPHPGWAELDPVALWESTRATMDRALDRAGATASDVVAVGVTSHRETTVVWERATGRPVHDALVWISHQTDDIVRRWDRQGLAGEFRTRTGLRNDSFFSAAKVVWLLENVPGLRARAERGEVCFGTVDTWLLWNLTGGRVHATDPSCASRTALFHLAQLRWDDELAALLDVPTAIYPHVLASDARFGTVDPAVLPSAPPVTAVLADQQAGMFGQACFEPGATKNTFGTASVVTVNTGERSQLVEGLTSSVGWTVQDRTAFELEGVVFHSGQTLQWLRDSLGIAAPADRIDEICASVPDAGGVYVVPAFGGMCAPHWDRRARASIVGLSLHSGGAHVIRAAVDAMAYQTCDILDTLAGDVAVDRLKVDGGGAASDLLCQLTADLSGLPVVRPRELERTALGVAYVAGFGVGLWDGPADVEKAWEADRTFEPAMAADRRAELYAGWRDALARTLTVAPGVGTAAVDHPSPSAPAGASPA